MTTIRLYKTRRKNNKKAIFNTKTGQQVSEWWDDINIFYLLDDNSLYYLAKNQDGKWAAFHINNPDEPITQWWDWVAKAGL